MKFFDNINDLYRTIKKTLYETSKNVAIFWTTIVELIKNLSW